MHTRRHGFGPTRHPLPGAARRGATGLLALLGLLIVPPPPPEAAVGLERVSVSGGGARANEASVLTAMNADGRFVAFDSDADNLVNGDTNQTTDVFVRDLQSRTTERASVSSAGAQGNGLSTAPSISGEGRFVAFDSDADNLVAGDTNGATDVFVRDRQARATERISMSDTGPPGSGDSGSPAISQDGRFVAFVSGAPNLVSGDLNGMRDIFVRDRQAGTTERVSLGSAGEEANGPSLDPAISGDGRFVAFASAASNLVADDTNQVVDVFVRDRQTGITERVSRFRPNSVGELSDSSGSPALSADGRFVAFESAGNPAGAPDFNGEGTDIFVYDRQTGIPEMVSINEGGLGGIDPSPGPLSISADGRFVAFASGASNLTPFLDQDTNDAIDVFVRDRQAGTTERVSRTPAGAEGSEASEFPAISADGRFVAFSSSATNLAGPDSNNAPDILVVELGAAGGNQAPVADAGEDRTVRSRQRQVKVRLNGRGSRDPDGDPLTFAWAEAGAPLATGPRPTVKLGVGQHALTLTATDPQGATGQDTVVITVQRRR